MANTSLDALWEKVHSQKERIPSLYGNVDFSKTPERFTTDIHVDSMLPRGFAKKYRAQILADADRVERARAYTMLGDIVADAYAAQMPKYGFRRLIDMLKQACDESVENVKDAPQELVDFIRSMERVPEWVDMDLVEEGARVSRIHMANMVPFAIRGAFIATFMNKYSGLPMALTGTLSSESAVTRVNETASFFTTASLPGALRRDGVGFKAAAMVRLMHSMVRFNLMHHSKAWDLDIYGIPIPQVDQMPAGTIPAFLTAFRVMRSGRRHFTHEERAIVELCRYQSYLLGLPEELLPATPKEILDVMLAYSATLREGYDDATCGELVRATMGAYRPKDHTLPSRIYNAVETGFSKVFFTQTFLRGGEQSRARQMGVKPAPKDYVLAMVASMYFGPKMLAHMVAMRLPGVDKMADRILVRKINKLLVEYGHAEYTTDAAKYKEAKDGTAAAA